jgi:hypothetical protein
MLPTTFRQLYNIFVNGAMFDLECREKIEDLESYPDKGTRLTVYGMRDDKDDVLALQVSYHKYDDYNTAFEKANYFDKEGRPCLTARDAGFYNVKDTLYVMATDNPNDYFISLDALSNVFINRYIDEKRDGETYVAFLERLLHTAGIK